MAKRMDDSSVKKKKKTRDLLVPVIYYHPHYLATQTYESLRSFNNDCFEIHFTIEEAIANSLPKSPFGGILTTHFTKQDLTSFWNHVVGKLQEENVKEIRITQPPAYYSGFVTDDHLRALGFTPFVTETNQYLPMNWNAEANLHTMQKRKLARNSHLEIKKIPPDSFHEIHRFITECRRRQGLKINISRDTLMKLAQVLPGAYEAWAGYFDGRLACAVITTLPTDKVAYYYLPATHPDFKKESPMVRMILHLAEEYQKRGFEYFDLGVSSIHGQLQTSLYQFKKRMGCVSTDKITFAQKIC